MSTDLENVFSTCNIYTYIFRRITRASRGNEKLERKSSENILFLQKKLKGLLIFSCLYNITYCLFIQLCSINIINSHLCFTRKQLQVVILHRWLRSECSSSRTVVQLVLQTRYEQKTGCTSFKYVQFKKNTIFNRVATSLRDTSAAAKVVEFSILEFPTRTHMSAVEVDGGGAAPSARSSDHSAHIYTQWSSFVLLAYRHVLVPPVLTRFWRTGTY
jgi:hypothetical protein